MQTRNLFGYSAISLEIFEEERPLGVSADLTKALQRRFLAGGINITNQRDTASATLNGKISNIANRPSSLAGSGSSIPAYQIQMQLAVFFKEPSGKTLWEQKFTFSEDYLSPKSATENAILKTESNKRRALTRLADKIASEIHQQLFLNANIHKQQNVKSQ